MVNKKKPMLSEIDKEQEGDLLELEIAQDNRGEAGDVRDIIISRVLHKWEIGLSAKNNHSAVKHSRLSDTIDFGKSGWTLLFQKSIGII